MNSEPECRPWLEQEEGPYHRDGEPFRQDLVEDRIGVPLRLAVRLVDDDDTPIAGAVVDVWHCDALGRYSGFGPPGDTSDDGQAAEHSDERFLRGRQWTDEAGCCEFRTIYPGWYSGRTVHIHVIAEVAGHRSTSQFFFPEDLNDEILARPPYNQRPDRDTTNTSDEIFTSHREHTVPELAPDGDGYRATICLRVGGRN